MIGSIFPSIVVLATNVPVHMCTGTLVASTTIEGKMGTGCHYCIESHAVAQLLICAKIADFRIEKVNVRLF